MTAPAYGYAHRARVLREGGAEGTYVVHIPTLAPGCASGPFPSTVRDLAPGDSVLLTQIGLTGGDLVITGRLPERAPDVTLPINISDVVDLQAALDNRATDAELAALAASTSAEFVTVDGRLDTAEADITALEAVDTALDGRLDTAEAIIATHTANIATNTANITTATTTNNTQDTRLTNLETWSRPHQNAEFDAYGDTFIPFPRMFGSNARTLGNNIGYRWITKARVAGNMTRVRVVVRAAGVGASANCAGVLYKSSTLTGTYTQVGFGTNTLTATGVQDFTFTSTPVSAGDFLMALLLGGNYTTAAVITGLQNAVTPASSLSPVWATKAAMPSAPATIVPNDGTWTADGAPWWVCVA